MLTGHRLDLLALLLLCFGATRIHAKDRAPKAVNLQFSQQRGFYRGPFELTLDRTMALSAPASLIFYTDDGRDPRLPGGQVAAGARQYESALPVEPGRRIKARAATAHGSGLDWSALAEFSANP